jgi:hypothetical protein
MRIPTGLILILLTIVSCTELPEKNCYPKEQVKKVVILVADTSVLPRFFNIENDTASKIPVYNGIGFVRRDGTPVHNPLMTLTLLDNQRSEFLRILRPIPKRDEGTTTGCVPIYRHAVLFYGNTDNLIGQMHICFGCQQVYFSPEPDCLNFFDNVRLNELQDFFQTLQIPIMKD